MNKNIKVWGVRGSLAGDMIFALPILNYIESKYPGSYKYWVIHKKCAGFAPIFFNHPLINNIRITKGKESLGEEDIRLANDCNIIFNISPQHPDGMPATTPESHWWNYYNVYEETFRMSGLHVDEYKNMPKELKYPKLVKWFDVVKDNSIGIWPFSSYGPNNPRSPSRQWWDSFIEKSLKLCRNVNFYQFGAESDPSIHPLIIRQNNLSIFDQIKKSLCCQVNITTNSGSGAILGAYGEKQVTLLTDDAPNHLQNFNAFAPLNYNELNRNVFKKGGCDNINQDVVINIVKELLNK